MKFNLKVLIAVVLIVVVSIWAVTSVQSRSYSGTDLNVPVGQGTVTVTNPSDASVPVQLTSTGTRVFSVSSTLDGLSGRSTTQGTGRTATQLLELTLPQGSSMFTVVSNSAVNLVAISPNSLDVTLQPMSDSAMRATLIAAGLFVVVAIFYISHATGHHLVKSLLHRQAEPVTAPVLPVGADVAGGQGHAIRSYGDNRVDISEKN